MRHGETDWNAAGRAQGIEDIPLNLAGIQQALNRRPVFRGHDLKVFVSPLSRAVRSADLATRDANREIFQIDERLIEYDFGDESRKAEDIDHFFSRIIEALKSASQYDGNVLLVSHGAVIHNLINLFLPEDLKDARLPLYNCSVSVIDYDKENDRFELIGVNLEDKDLEEILKSNDHKT